MTSILYSKHFDNFTVSVCVPFMETSVKHTSVIFIGTGDEEVTKTCNKYELLFHFKEVNHGLIELLKEEGFKTTKTQSPHL